MIEEGAGHQVILFKKSSSPWKEVKKSKNLKKKKPKKNTMGTLSGDLPPRWFDQSAPFAISCTCLSQQKRLLNEAEELRPTGWTKTETERRKPLTKNAWKNATKQFFLNGGGGGKQRWKSAPKGNTYKNVTVGDLSRGATCNHTKIFVFVLIFFSSTLPSAERKRAVQQKTATTHVFF